MNKKGIIFEQTVVLILAVVGLVLLIYVFLSMGLGGAMKDQTSSAICTFSSYTRGVLVKFILSVWSVISVAMVVVFAASGGTSSSIAVAASEGGSRLFSYLFRDSMIKSGAGTLAAGSLSITAIITYLMISQMLSAIPFVCPVVTLDIGQKMEGQFESPEKAANIIGAKIMSTYSMFGEGNFDPLIGLDPPNPRIAYILELHLNKDTNFSYVYETMFSNYEENWNLGSGSDLRLYLYCQQGERYLKMGNNPENFERCEIRDSRIYILYKDAHEYDLFSYGSSVCGGKITEDSVRIDLSATTGTPFHNPEDVIVVCIEEI